MDTLRPLENEGKLIKARAGFHRFEIVETSVRRQAPRRLTMEDNMETKQEATVVAVTRDGRVYVNTMNAQKGKIPGKYAARVLLWVGKALNFFFIRVLRGLHR